MDLKLIEKFGIPVAQVVASGSEIYVERENHAILGEVVVVIAIKRASPAVFANATEIIKALVEEKGRACSN